MIRKSYDPGQSKDVLALGDLLGVDITTSLIGELDGNELKQPKIDAALHEELPLRDRESAQCSNNVEQVQMATALAALGWPLVPEQPPLLLPMSEDDSPQIIANNSQTIKALELALHSQHRDAPMPKWDTAWNAENLHMLCSALKPTDIHQNVSHHAKSKTLSKRSHTFVDASTDVDLTGLKFVDETAPTMGVYLGRKKNARSHQNKWYTLMGTAGGSMARRSFHLACKMGNSLCREITTGAHSLTVMQRNQYSGLMAQTDQIWCAYSQESTIIFSNKM